jgi:hypothetical protein
MPALGLNALRSRTSHNARAAVEEDKQYADGCAERLGMLPDSSLLSDSCLACHGRNLELPLLA